MTILNYSLSSHLDCHDQRAEYKCDHLQIMLSRLFLSVMNLQQSAFSGFVDELVRGVLHAGLA
jgi:hypothetical protein